MPVNVAQLKELFRYLAAVIVVPAVAFAFLMLPARAATDSVYMDLSVNGVAHDSVLVVLRGSDVLVAADDLRAAGVDATGKTTETLHSRPYVALSALADTLTYKVDLPKLQLAIRLAAKALKHETVSLASDSTIAPASTAGLVLNYDVRAASGTPWTGSIEQRLNLTNGAVVDDTVGRSFDGTLQRGLTDVTIDSPQRLRRTIVGDAFAGTGDLGGSAILGGITVQRAFSTNPYVATFPLPSVTASVLEPSEADIIVNGAVVKTIDLPPGQYNLNDLPIHEGIDRAQVVLRNGFGAQTLFDATLYGSAALLRKGLTDYDYAIGADRHDLESTGDGYGPAAALGSYRIGLSNWSTAGARIETGANVLSAGLNYDGILRFADVHVAVAQSQSDGRRGDALSIGYSSSGITSGFSLVARAQSPFYTNLSQHVADDRALFEFDGSGSRRLSADTSLSLTTQVARYRDSGNFRQVAVNLSRRMGKMTVSLSAAEAESSGDGPQRSLSLLLGFPIDASTVATAEVDAGSTAGTVTQIVHAPSTPFDTSYSIAAGPYGASPVGSAARFGLPFAAVSLQQSGGFGHLPLSDSVDVSGALERIDGHTLFSQAVPDAYALVEAPGAGNAPIYLNNRYAGRTNADGYAVVPFLASYEVNRVSLADDTFSFDQTLTGEDQGVQPAYHGAGVVRYHGSLERGLTGNVVRRDGRAFAYGELQITWHGRTYSSPTDESGRFYFSNLPRGTYQAVAADNAGSCGFTIDVPVLTRVQQSLGTVTCAK